MTALLGGRVRSLKRSGPPKRKKQMKKRNPTRRVAEFQRCYGSEERVAFVKALGCAVCGWDTKEARPGERHSIENAHTRSGGTGRKADADTIIPLCWTHHDEYDNGKKTFAAKYDFDPIARAAEVESAWRDWGEAANP